MKLRNCKSFLRAETARPHLTQKISEWYFTRKNLGVIRICFVFISRLTLHLVRSVYTELKWSTWNLQGYVRYIFVTLFFKAKTEHFWNQEGFLFYFKNSFRSWDIQISECQNVKFDEIIKFYQVLQHETRNAF